MRKTLVSLEFVLHEEPDASRVIDLGRSLAKVMELFPPKFANEEVTLITRCDIDNDQVIQTLRDHGIEVTEIEKDSGFIE